MKNKIILVATLDYEQWKKVMNDYKSKTLHTNKKNTTIFPCANVVLQ